jgi:hypothetical protein
VSKAKPEPLPPEPPNTLSAGYRCVCGAEHRYPAYVYAHWDTFLTHTCDACGAKTQVFEGGVCKVK